jgi:hypothetical protein
LGPGPGFETRRHIAPDLKPEQVPAAGAPGVAALLRYFRSSFGPGLTGLLQPRLHRNIFIAGITKRLAAG